MSAKWSLYYQLLKLCVPVFCFQTTEASLSDLLLQQMELATPVMAYVYGEDESKDELTLLAAIENSGKQEDTKNADIEISADAQKANEDEEGDTGSDRCWPGAENVAATATPVWTKQAEVNRDKLLDFDYLVKNFYRIDRTTTIDSSELNPGQLLAKDLTIDTNVDEAGHFDLSYTFTRRICGLGWIGRDDGHGAGGSPDKPFAGYIWDSCLASSGQI